MSLHHLFFSVAITFLVISCGGSSGAKSTNNAGTNMNSSTSSLTSSTSTSMNSSSSSSSLTQTNKKVLVTYGNNAMQVGELRLPQVATEKLLPLVIIIHGGCWVSAYADYHFMDKFADAVTNSGYATWNIEYRAIGTGGNWPVIFQDVGKAIDYTRTLAQQYPIDTTKVAIIGHSAGGHLALWAAGRSAIKSDNEIYTENPLKISGIISVAGIANVTANTGCNTLANDVIGMSISSHTSELETRLKITSPLQMLPIKTKTVLISGGADGIVPATIGAEYSKKATEFGDNSLHYVLQGLDHFDLIDPDKTNWLLYQQSLQEIFHD